MTAQEFDTLLKQGKIPGVCLLYGEESFLAGKAVQRVVDQAVDQSLKDFNYNVFYGNETKGADILDAALTLPMFAERRVVLVKRIENLSAAACDAILPYFQNPSSATCLIFTGSKIDLRRKFYIELKKHAATVEFKKIYDSKLCGFITSEAGFQGRQIESAAANLLSYLIGNNLQELSSQIEKLAVFAGTRTKITVDDVKTIASDSKSFTAFELAKFLGTKDLQNALKSLEKLFLNGDDIPMLIGALTRHFRQLWQVRELLDRKIPPPAIAKEAGINPYFLDDMTAQARNFNRPRIREIFAELCRCDIASKTGGSPFTLMHSLVMEICS